MKSKVNISCYLLVFIMFLFINTYQLFGQKKLAVSGGVGFPESLNVGMRYQFKQSKIGFSAGTFPCPEAGIYKWKWESLISLSGDLYYHFAGSSGFSDTRPWYGRIGLNCVRFDKVSYIQYKLQTYLRIGRDFNLSGGFGISVDVGPGFHFYDWFKPNGESKDIGDFFGIKAIPTFGVCLFYRF